MPNYFGLPCRISCRVPALGLTLLALSSSPAFAQDASPGTPRTGSGLTPADKAEYTLFNPTPREEWRPLAADRPDATESPITVDAGAFQIEASFAELAYDREDGMTTTAVSAAPINFKIGLTNNIDLQLLFNPYERVETDTAGGGSRIDRGVGDLGVRAKINLWGNDAHLTGGTTALGLIPYIIFPTGEDSVTDDAWQVGMVVPFAVELGGGWSLGTQVELAYASPNEGDETAAFAHTAALGRDLFGNLGGYIEYIGEYQFVGEAEYRPTASAGLTYTLSADAVLDAGFRAGLDNDDTTDLVLFAGITTRF